MPLLLGSKVYVLDNSKIPSNVVSIIKPSSLNKYSNSTFLALSFSGLYTTFNVSSPFFWSL